MGLDVKEIAAYLVGRGHWRESSGRPEAMEYLVLDGIQAGRGELLEELKKLLPSMRVYRDGAHADCKAGLIVEEFADERREAPWKGKPEKAWQRRLTERIRKENERGFTEGEREV